MLRFLRLSFVAVIAVVCLSIYASHTEAAPLETTTLAEETTTIRKCMIGTPCGWAVYGHKTTSKKANYFLRNNCDCDFSISDCTLTNEDVSLSAYVYRCVAKPENKQPDSA